MTPDVRPSQLKERVKVRVSQYETAKNAQSPNAPTQKPAVPTKPAYLVKNAPSENVPEQKFAVPRPLTKKSNVDERVSRGHSGSPEVRSNSSLGRKPNRVPTYRKESITFFFKSLLIKSTVCCQMSRF